MINVVALLMVVTVTQLNLFLFFSSKYIINLDCEKEEIVSEVKVKHSFQQLSAITKVNSVKYFVRMRAE